MGGRASRAVHRALARHGEARQRVPPTRASSRLAPDLRRYPGGEAADNAGEDSFSLLPLLRGEDKPIRANAVSASSGGMPAVRLGQWKYIPAPGSGGWGTGGDQSQPVQLYNLADDLGETNNLAAAKPEKVAEMKALLEKLITDGRSTPGAPQKNDVEVKRYPAKPTPHRRSKRRSPSKLTMKHTLHCSPHLLLALFGR